MSEISGRGPRMSVVIPNYNHGHLIEDALFAISQQTLPPSEVVVVDDGSTDDSLARLQSSAARLPWLRIHTHGENRGVNAACNTGLELVSGDFVLFLRCRRSTRRQDRRARLRGGGGVPNVRDRVLRSS